MKFKRSALWGEISECWLGFAGDVACLKTDFLDFGCGGYISMQGGWSWVVCGWILDRCIGGLFR